MAESLRHPRDGLRGRGTGVRAGKPRRAGGGLAQSLESLVPGAAAATGAVMSEIADRLHRAFWMGALPRLAPNARHLMLSRPAVDAGIRAVIKILREPNRAMETAGMTEAARQYTGDDTNSPTDVVDYMAIYRAILTEALK